MSFPYKNPISSIQVNGTQSVPRNNTYGTTFSVNNTGGYMEVYSLSDLYYTIPSGTTGSIKYSGNTIPIEFTKGTGAAWSPDVITLASDNISSGRRRLGMLAYVYEEDQVYQYYIDNYETLFNAATASTGCAQVSNFGTTINNKTAAGQTFINAWTGNTIQDVSGATYSTAVWRKFSSGGGVSGAYLPLSGGTVTGGTIFTSGLTANTISATTYYNLPTDVFVTGGTYTSGNAIFTNNTGGTFTVTGFAIGGGGGQLFYLNLSQSQGSNRLLSTTASTASQQTTGVTINNGVTGSIASFQSQPLNITLLPGGIWSFYLHSYKGNTNASFDIFVEVYKRTSGGTQTLLFSTDPTPVTTNSPNPSMQLSDSYFSGTTLLVSDSIVATVRATNTGNQSHTITLVTEGSTHYSYVVSTIPTQQGITCDTLSGCTIIQTIQTDLTNKLDKSGGTISGGLVVNSGLTATTISATTYVNLPSSSATFTGGTVSGATNFTGGLTATTISATTLTVPKTVINYQTITDGTAVTATVASTLTSSILIPANTVAVGDIMNIRVRLRKTGTAGTVILRFYVNTSAAIGGSLVGTSTTAGATTLYNQMTRVLTVKSVTVTETLQAGGAATTDDVVFTGAVSSNNIDWTVTQHFVAAIQNSSIADSSLSSFIHIQINKA